MSQTKLQLSEKEYIKGQLGNFSIEQSTAWNLIKIKLGRTLNHNELRHLANIFETVTGIKTNRFEKRNKDLLVKYFEDHIDLFKDFISKIGYVDKNDHYGGPMAEETKEYFNDDKVSDPEDVFSVFTN